MDGDSFSTVFDDATLTDTFLELTPNMIAFLDTEDRIVKISREACRFLGIESPAEAIGIKVLKLMKYPVLALLTKKCFESLNRGMEVRETYPLILPDSPGFRWFSVFATNVSRDGRLVGKVFFINDVTGLYFQKSILDGLAMSIPGMVAVFDRDLNIHMGTDLLARENGFRSCRDLPGKNLRDLPVLDVEMILIKLDEVILEDMPVTWTSKVKDHAGKIRWFRDDLRLIESSAGIFGYILTMFEVTEEIKPKAILESLMDTTTDLIVITDPQGTVEYASTSSVRLVGLEDRKDVIGRPWQYLFNRSGPNKKKYEALFSEVWPTGYRMLSIDGPEGKSFLNSRVDRLTYEGEEFGDISISSNMTELVVAREQAESATKAKAAFLANMTHELRTPMNAVLGMNELLTRTTLSPIQRNYVSQIRSSASLLLSIINDILDFSRLEARKMELNPGPYRIVDLMHDVASLVLVKAQEKELSFTVDLDPFVPSTLVGDGMRVKQILINLLNNAVKFTNEGSVNLAISGNVSRDRKSFNLEMVISDTGIGIPQEMQSRLFEEFSRIEGASGASVEGSGLGLSICHGLVTLMCGTIGLESEAGVGSSFTVKLKQAIPEGSRAVAEFTGEGDVRLLVYDRDPATLKSIRRMIRSAGIKAECTTTIEEFSARLGRKEAIWTHVIFEYATGYELALQAASAMPGATWLALLSMSDFLGKGKDPSISFLFKPFMIDSFALFIRGEPVDFMMSLPISSTMGVSPSNFPSRDCRVLVVDDNAVNRKVAVGFLETLGIGAEEAASGEEALKAASSRAFDLVLMDHVMPGMDGLETAARLRKLPGYGKVPIIALTANSGDSFRETYRTAGFEDMLSKPMEFNAFMACLGKWLPGDAGRIAGDAGDPAGARNAAVRATGAKARVAEGTAGGEWIAGLDHASALSYTGSEKNLAMILKIFNRSGPGLLEKLEAGRASGDVAEFRTAAHSLISSCANVGAREVSERARELEAAILAGKAGDIDRLYPLVHGALKGALDGVAEYFRKANAATSGAESGGTT